MTDSEPDELGEPMKIYPLMVLISTIAALHYKSEQQAWPKQGPDARPPCIFFGERVPASPHDAYAMPRGRATLHKRRAHAAPAAGVLRFAPAAARLLRAAPLRLLAWAGPIDR